MYKGDGKPKGANGIILKGKEREEEVKEEQNPEE